MILVIKLAVWVAIVVVLEFTAVFAYKLADKINNKRIKKLKLANKRLVEQSTRFHNDYKSIYENMVRVNTMMRELQQENENLKKELDTKENVTYYYYINK